MTIQSLTRQIEANRHWFRRINGRRNSFGLQGEDYAILSQHEEQRLVRIAERIERLYKFRGWIMARSYEQQ